MIKINHKFKVGDCVQFKELSELHEEFGRLKDVPSGFNSIMKYLCGQTAHILRFNEFDHNCFYTVEDIESTPERRWILNVAMIKPFDEFLPDVEVPGWEQIISIQ